MSPWKKTGQGFLAEPAHFGVAVAFHWIRLILRKDPGCRIAGGRSLMKNWLLIIPDHCNYAKRENIILMPGLYFLTRIKKSFRVSTTRIWFRISWKDGAHLPGSHINTVRSWKTIPMFLSISMRMLPTCMY